ncbi:MAG: hypothetical protein FJZ01_09305 [Candidatus Sericytochromatia bacterium]|nr:hypothetical protein [Candidatus Tanganyikabacteria bacterium]
MFEDPVCKPGGYWVEGGAGLPLVDLSPGEPRDPPPEPPAVSRVLAGDAAGALRSALARKDPEDRYLELVLVAAACARRGEDAPARAAAVRAVEHYRPIVEEGLYLLYARYLADLAGILPPAEIGGFAAAMEPEVAALGALPAAADDPLPFLALYNDLLHAASGWEATLAHARRHAASHLLLGDLARRAPSDAELDAALADLAAEAAREAAALATKAARAADPFTRDLLRRSLLRQVAALRCLFDRDPDLAGQTLWPGGETAIPFHALAGLPRGLRLEALLPLSAALAPLPAGERAALYPHFLQAVHPPGVETGSMLRRQAAAVARITVPFLDAASTAAGDLAGLVAWFLAEEAELAEGAAEESARNFAQALLPLGLRAAAPLEDLLAWAEDHAVAAAPAVLAAWAVATEDLPTALRPECFDTPQRTFWVLREAPPGFRRDWAEAAFAWADWDLEALVRSADLDEQRAVADLLTYCPDPLADPALAAAARDVILGERHGAGPYGRTLALLGPEPEPYPLAVLLEARVGTRGNAAPEHDQALRAIVAWELARDANAALRLAAGFGTRNHVSWLLGTLLAEGRASALDPAAVQEAAPHPFLLGAYLLETAP